MHLEKATGKTVLELKPAEVCQSLGCDGLVYGKITDFKKVYAAVYSQLGVEAEVWIVNTKTGERGIKVKGCCTVPRRQYSPVSAWIDYDCRVHSDESQGNPAGKAGK